MPDEHRIVASTRIIAGLTLLSRILGLAREMAYAQFFGTGPLLSAFRIAFMVPNLSRRLFGEGALSAAFIPVVSRTLHRTGREGAERLAGGVLTLLVPILGGLIVILEIGFVAAHAIHPSPVLVLTAIMLPFMGLICVAAFLGGLLNVLGRFAAPAAAPMLLNAFVIAALILGGCFAGLSQMSLIYLVCGAVLLAGGAQVGLQWLSLRAARFHVRLRRDWRQPEIAEVTSFMGPMMVGLSAVQLNTLFDMLIAWFFVADGEGPAVLGYAHFMYQLPLGVFGIALATAIFPVLAARAAADDMRGLSSTLLRGARLSFFISLPASIGLIVIADPLVAVLFHRGEFGTLGAERTSSALVLYSCGLCAYAFQHIVVRALYALKQHATAARVAVVAVAVNVALNLLLVRPLGESGVALATVVSAVLQVVWLSSVLRRQLPSFDRATLLRSALRTIASSAVMGLCVWGIVHPESPLGTGGWAPMTKVVVAVPVGAAVAMLVARAAGATEITELLRRKSPATL